MANYSAHFFVFVRFFFLSRRFKDNVRAVLFPTGYILSPLQGQTVDIHHSNGTVTSSTDACLLTFIAQFDREGVLIVSPDLLGETNELRQTISNIKIALGNIHGIRTLRPSIHTQNLRSINHHAEMMNMNSNTLYIPPTSPVQTYEENHSMNGVRSPQFSYANGKKQHFFLCSLCNRFSFICWFVFLI